MPSLIGQTIGRYRIVQRIGRGGMAVVYRARDTRLERDVAVKVIRVDQFAPAVLERILKRFEREAKALARLTHPNIVHVNDYGENEGVPYLVLDYLPGGTLKQLLGKPMPWQEAFKLILPVAEALDYAHSQNIIHRDVKPSNILLTQRGQPMLTDFGIAKLLEIEEAVTLTGTGVGVGTPEYMAPEQVDARSVDRRADIYSLGIVLYELITGRKPFQADTPMAVMIMQARDSLPQPRQFIPDLPEDVEQVLLQALAKNPEDRFQSMGAFATAMENLAGSHPMTAVSGNENETADATIERTVLQPTHKDETSSTFDQGPTRERVPPAAGITPPSPPPVSTGWPRWLPWAGAAAALFLIIFLSFIFGRGSAPKPTPTPTQPYYTKTSIPTKTRTATLIPTYTFQPTYTLFPTYTIPPTRAAPTKTTKPASNTPYFIPDTDLWCRDGPGNSYGSVWQVYQGVSIPVLGAWYQNTSWILVDINDSKTSTDCCWIASFGRLSVSTSSLKRLTGIPDRKNCSAYK